MPRKILLADDSVTAQNMGRRILSDAGYEVVTVNNGPAALKKLAEQKPDLAILDVYMPGYGGIEVCQRIKESAETAGIPVLLTVGKLEPFKPDEAKRVRADAHLVKPFEATELLAALTRLEDKIVPQAGSRSPAKAGKSKGVEKASPAKDKQFGDSDSGWRQRLTIPPAAKREEAAEKTEEAAEEKPAPSTAFRNFARPAAEAEVTTNDTLPPDITAEEIAAITAAAAAFENGRGPIPASDDEAFRAQCEEEIAAAGFGEAARTAETAPLPPETPATGVEEAAEPPQALESRESAGAETLEPAKPGFEIEQAAAAETVPAIPPPSEAEVAAALEALSPTNGASGAPHDRDRAADLPAGLVVESMAGVDRGWGGSERSGTRWVAEEVSLAHDEAAVILEEEMEKAYSAMAQAGVERAESTRAEAAVGEESMQFVAPPANDTVPEPEQVPVEEQPVRTVAMESAQEVPAEIGQPAAGNEEASTVTLQAQEPNREPEPEPEGADVVAQAAEAEASQPEVVEAVANDSVEASGANEEAAYAAAASSGTEFRTISHTAEQSTEAQPEIDQNNQTAPPSEQEATLAAAWANWRQIRESIANPQFTQQVADAAAAGYKEIHKPAASASEPEGKSAAAPAADSSAIASIVESVLAELKPKLVEEIAKKLGGEKK